MFAHADTATVGQAQPLELAGMRLPQSTIDTFLARFSATATDLAAMLAGHEGDGRSSIEDAPLLRTGHWGVPSSDSLGSRGGSHTAAQLGGGTSDAMKEVDSGGGGTVQRMSALDASFLLLEDASTLLHLGSVSIFEGPAPSHEEFHRLVYGTLPLSRRHRQKVRGVPFDLARPVWVDDPHFNVDYHLRRTALPSPGDHDQLRLLVGRIMSQQLDRTKPLWELWVVEGLADGTWAQINKLHHSMVDGLAAVDMITLILDRDRDASRPPSESWQPRPEPST